MMLILRHNHAASVAPTSNVAAATGYPLSNLALPWRSSIWRTASIAGTVELRWDLGASMEVAGFAFDGGNLTAAGTARVRLSTISDLSSPSYDSGTGAAYDLTHGALEGALSQGRPIVRVPPAPVSGRYVGLDLVDTGNPDGHIQLRGAWMGPGLQLPFEDWISPDEFAGEAGLEAYRGSHRIHLHRLTEAESRQVSSLVRALGSTGRLWVIPRPGEPASWVEEALFATIASAGPRSPLRTRERLWSRDLDLVEVGD